MKKYKFIVLLIPVLLGFTNIIFAQEDSVITEELVKLKYFSKNNSIQFLEVESYLKTGKKTKPVAGKVFKLYLDSIVAGNLIGTVRTVQNGKAKSFLPPALKAAWDASGFHKFLAVATIKGEELITELEISKAKIQIDTASADGIRSITVQVMKYENNEWVPANEVEMKVGIQRHASLLSAGETESYTTDSTGTAMVELDKDSLPGDNKGNIILMAKVEDNDLFGNLVVEKTVPWGVAFKADHGFFNQRTLWTTRFRTPFWLLFMAYSIVIGVWAVIFYLILQVIKIKKLGTEQKDTVFIQKDSVPAT